MITYIYIQCFTLRKCMYVYIYTYVCIYIMYMQYVKYIWHMATSYQIYIENDLFIYNYL